MTGEYKKLALFTLIIVIHEIGHLIAGYLVNWKIDKICIYPYGGCTVFNTVINVRILDELFVIISGPLLQILFLLLMREKLSYYDSIIFIKYNYAILIFNLLPIYPLDGGKILNLFLKKIIPYKSSLVISIYFSIVGVFLMFILGISLSFYLILFFLLIRIFDEYKKINILYNKFLLERYLYSFSFKRLKIVKDINNMFFDKKNIIKCKKKYLTEKECLKRYFNV